MSISKIRGIEAAKNFRKGSRELQVALQYAVEQSLAGNADGIDAVFRASGLMYNSRGVLMGTKVSAAVFDYLNADPENGGCGLSGIVRFDKEQARFVMGKGWKGKKDQLDFARIFINLSDPQGWVQFKAEKAETVYDLEKAVATLVKRAQGEGHNNEDISYYVEKALKDAAKQ